VLDWDDLRFFLAVAREGSLSRAARTLKVSQPTAGRRIATFERQLGAELFVATPSGQTLSPTGRRILAYVERMDDDALTVGRIASGRDAGLRGQVRVTASEWLVDGVLAPLVASFSARHPGLELELVADPRHANLARREADIAVRPSRSEQKDIVHREVATISFGLYASDGYLAERGTPDFTRGAPGHALVAMSESLGRIPDVAWLPRVVGNARVVVRTNGRVPMAKMAATGVGLACLPRFLGDATPSLRLLPTPVPAPERRLWLAFHGDVRAVPRVEATVAFLAEGVARLRAALRPEGRS
jgi:DNA-binding transcriptional LysR family regulator